MNGNRFDSIFGLLAGQRDARRTAPGSVRAGLPAGAHVPAIQAQEATPLPSTSDDHERPVLLFLQAFRGGRVVPAEGVPGLYTLTLEQGLGHTIYFSDRPHRVVGAMPTPEFLGVLGFPDDNPPNAALVVETGPGQTELFVIELFDPAYDESTHTASYDVVVLAGFERSNGFAQTDTDLADLLPEFGAAHLFIDSTVGCGIATLTCWLDGEYIGDIETLGVCSYNFATQTCEPSDFSQAGFASREASYTSQCNGRYSACGGDCIAMDTCPA